MQLMLFRFHVYLGTPLDKIGDFDSCERPVDGNSLVLPSGKRAIIRWWSAGIELHSFDVYVAYI